MNEKDPVRGTIIPFRPKQPTPREPDSPGSPREDVNNSIAQPPNITPISRAKSYQIGIDPSSPNYEQYVRVVKAYAAAGMTFADIANAADELGDQVVRGETDAPIKDGRQRKIGEIVEDEDRILAWQDRGEKISITAPQAPQLTAASSMSLKSATVSQVPATRNLGDKKIGVIEGIDVRSPNYNSISTPSNEQLPTSSHDADLLRSTYLNTPADWKKAA